VVETHWLSGFSIRVWPSLPVRVTLSITPVKVHWVGLVASTTNAVPATAAVVPAACCWNDSLWVRATVRFQVWPVCNVR